MNWKIQLCELNYDENERAACQNVLETEWLTMGERVSKFENEFSEFLKLSNQSVAVSSATAGLHLILMALHIGKGDEVIIPGLTFVSDANVVMQLGAKPIFADSNSLNDLNVSVESIKSKITQKTKAVIVVHFAGYPMDLTELRAICDIQNIKLIEDVAHAPGASIQNNMCGTVGHCSFFSFFSNKNLAVGEGGMVASHDTDLLKKVRALRSHGMTSLTMDRHLGRANSYDVSAVGLNYRIDEIRAALGIVQLTKLEKGNLKRAQLVMRYKENLKNVNTLVPFDLLPASHKPAYHIMPILLPSNVSRVQVMEGMRDTGIQTSIHYPAFHSFNAYGDIIKKGSLPIADEICARELTLPLHPRMTVEDVDEVVQNLEKNLK